MRKRVFFNYT